MVTTIALLGGESTGKTTLASQLYQELSLRQPVILVREALREFVAQMGRPPRSNEQEELLLTQIAAEQAAASRLREFATGPDTAGLVISDPAVLMTAVYSQLYLADESLLELAVARTRQYDHLFWCLGDFPWVPEPGMRDGANYREAAELVIDQILSKFELPAIRLTGVTESRLDTTLAELAGHDNA